MSLPLIKSTKPTGIKAFCEEGSHEDGGGWGASVVIVIWCPKGTNHGGEAAPGSPRGLFLTSFLPLFLSGAPELAPGSLLD